MAVRRLAWVTGITLAACWTGDVSAPTEMQPTRGAVLAQVADPAAGSAPSAAAPLPDAAVLSLDDFPHDDRGAALPADGDQLAGPVLPPEVVSAMTYDQYRLTLDSHGAGSSALESSRGDAVDLVLGSASVVDVPAPPADMEIE